MPELCRREWGRAITLRSGQVLLPTLAPEVESEEVPGSRQAGRRAPRQGRGSSTQSGHWESMGSPDAQCCTFNFITRYRLLPVF